jgi:hypothetical protein
LSKRLLLLSIWLATIALVVGFSMSDLWGWSSIILAFGFLWWFVQRGRRDQITSVFPLLYIGTAIIGVWLNLSVGLMLFSMVATLAAWDLDNLIQRFNSFGRIEQPQELEHRHIKRLMIVSTCGMLLALIALQTKVTLSFSISLLMGFAIVISLSQAIGFLRSEGD